MLAMSPGFSPAASAGQAFPSTTMLPSASRCPRHQPSSMLIYWYPAAFMPFAAIALACAIAICASMMLEKLFHDDQPMGGGGTGMGRAEPGPAARAEADIRMGARTAREALPRLKFVLILR